MTTKLKYPSIAAIAEIVKALKPRIDDDCIEDEDTLPSIGLTIGYSLDGSWDYQSGDNSYSGGAYHHRYWGVVQIYRRSNSRELAKDIINQISEATYCADRDENGYQV
jgi:hypothetical protein